MSSIDTNRRSGECACCDLTVQLNPSQQSGLTSMGLAPSKNRIESKRLVRVTGVSTRLSNSGKERSAGVGVRVCVRVEGKPVCAVAKRDRMRSACSDACKCACAAAAEPVGGWWKRRSIKSECTSTCVPACDQPPRVSRSEFEVLVR